MKMIKLFKRLHRHEYNAMDMYTTRDYLRDGYYLHHPCAKCGKEYVVFFTNADIDHWIYGKEVDNE